MSSGTSPIGSPDSGNGVAITQAAARDMGILIISPFDKGGKLYEPSEQLVTACAPRVPLQYGALWIWNHEQIHTITVGAERPSDFHTHLDAAQVAGTADGAQYVELVDTRLEALQNAAGFDEEWRSSWWHHLPSCFDVPGGVNVRLIVWMYKLFTSWGMLWYARARYATLENQTEKTKKDWDWTHGTPGDKLRANLTALLRSSGSQYADRIAAMVVEAHSVLGKAGIERTRGRVEGISSGRTQCGDIRPEAPYRRASGASLCAEACGPHGSKPEAGESFKERLVLLLQERSGEPLNVSALPKLYQDRFSARLPGAGVIKLKHLLADVAKDGVCVLQEKQGKTGRVDAIFIALPLSFDDRVVEQPCTSSKEEVKQHAMVGGSKGNSNQSESMLPDDQTDPAKPIEIVANSESVEHLLFDPSACFQVDGRRSGDDIDYVSSLLHNRLGRFVQHGIFHPASSTPVKFSI